MADILKRATEPPRGLRSDSNVDYCAGLIFTENISLEGCRLLRMIDEDEMKTLERMINYVR